MHQEFECCSSRMQYILERFPAYKVLETSLLAVSGWWFLLLLIVVAAQFFK